MKLLPLDTPERIELVAGWLGKAENYKWLDFGNGVQRVTPGDEDAPAGVVGLTNVDRNFKTASLWAVLGNKRYGGHTTEACHHMLTLAFTELGLQAVNAWTVETNIPAQRCLEQLHFRCIGRQRQCHYIDGRALDRLLFDLLATEHRDVPHAGLEHTSATDLRPAL